jgi:hypothetical protein
MKPANKGRPLFWAKVAFAIFGYPYTTVLGDVNLRYLSVENTLSICRKPVIELSKQLIIESSQQQLNEFICIHPHVSTLQFSDPDTELAP